MTKSSTTGMKLSTLILKIDFWTLILNSQQIGEKCADNDEDDHRHFSISKTTQTTHRFYFKIKPTRFSIKKTKRQLKKSIFTTFLVAIPLIWENNYVFYFQLNRWNCSLTFFNKNEWISISFGQSLILICIFCGLAEAVALRQSWKIEQFKLLCGK